MYNNINIKATPEGLRVGDLVRYRYDEVNTKTYLVATVDPPKYQPHDRYATLFGWNQPNCVGSIQRFRIDQLVVVSPCK
jgi:hypothetical protein